MVRLHVARCRIACCFPPSRPHRPPTSSVASRIPAAPCCPAPPSRSKTPAPGTFAPPSTVDTGDYVFTLLPIGSYTVKIELQGFSTQTSTRGPDAAATALASMEGWTSGRSARPCKSRRVPAAADRRLDAELAGHREGGAGPAGHRPQLHQRWCRWCRAPAKADQLARQRQPSRRPPADLGGVDQRRRRTTRTTS